MEKIKYYLRKRIKNQEVLNEAAELRKQVDNILKQISELGYGEGAVLDVSSVLSRRYGHEKFIQEDAENETLLLVEQIPDWKPVFNLKHEYDSLVDMKKWYQRKETTHEIVLDENGVQKTLSWDEFIASVKNLKWTKFGMPQKCNAEEETIWSYLRD